MKNPIQIQFPGSNLLFVFLRVEEPRDRISFDDLFLNLGYGSGIEISVGQSLEVRVLRCFSSRSQLFNCLEDGRAELIIYNVSPSTPG